MCSSDIPSSSTWRASPSKDATARSTTASSGPEGRKSPSATPGLDRPPDRGPPVLVGLTHGGAQGGVAGGGSPELEPPRPPVTGAVGIEDAVDQAGQPRPGVRRAVAGDSPPLGRPFALEGKGLGEEPLAGSEVVLDRADGDARLGGDVGKPRRFDASLADHPHRRAENLRLALGGETRSRAHAPAFACIRLPDDKQYGLRDVKPIRSVWHSKQTTDTSSSTP